MEDIIKLHEICGYLPYGLKVRWCDGKVDKINPRIDYDAKSEGEIDLQLFLFVIHETDTPGDLKPLLRPLSDLTKEIEHNGERFVPIVKLLQEYCFDTNEMTEQEINEYAESMIEIDMSYMVAQMLMEWHFDIHGLIDRNLALNLNDHEI